MSVSAPDLIHIAADGLSADISPIGAELQSLRDGQSRELLWHGDKAWWTGRAPILFPIVGAIAGDSHPFGEEIRHLPKHGFARRRRFSVVAQTPAAVTLRLEADAETLAAYPYRFRLDITFTAEAATLTTVATVTNLDATTIPASFGYHPAFLWPLPGAGDRADQCVAFERDEPEPASRIDANGLLRGPEAVNRIVDRRLTLDDSLFDDDALLYLAPRSRKVRFGATNGQGTALDITFPDMPHLGIWTKPGGAPYLCIEPWQGYASPSDYTGPLSGKPGMIHIEAGASRSFTMGIRIDQG